METYPELKHCEVNRATDYACFHLQYGICLHECQNPNWSTCTTSTPFLMPKKHQVKVLYISSCDSGKGSAGNGITTKQSTHCVIASVLISFTVVAKQSKRTLASHLLPATHDDIGHHLRKVTISHQLRRTSRTKNKLFYYVSSPHGNWQLSLGFFACGLSTV